VLHDGRQGLALELLGPGGAQSQHLPYLALRDVVHEVVGGSLVGDNFGLEAHFDELGQDGGGIAGEADGPAHAGGFLGSADLQGVLQGVGLLVDVAFADFLLHPVGYRLDDEADAVVHGDGQGLGAAHAAEAGGEGDGAGQGAVEVLVGHSREGFVGALEDALGGDVNPGAGRHLAVHHEAHLVELVEVFLGTPGGDEVGVGNEDAGSVGPGFEHTHGFARLHEHGFVRLQGLESFDDGLVFLPVAGGAAGTAVHNQLVVDQGYGGVEVVFEHAQGSFGLPGFAAQLGAVLGFDGLLGLELVEHGPLAVGLGRGAVGLGKGVGFEVELGSSGFGGELGRHEKWRVGWVGKLGKGRERRRGLGSTGGVEPSRTSC
jgi:hypothetical protein